MVNFRATFLSLFLFAACYGADNKYDWKCTDEICQTTLCPELPEECMDSEKALLVPSLDECNCCDHCYLFLDEGSLCQRSTGELELPNVMCGPGLTCNKTGVCEKMPANKVDTDFFKNYVCDENGRCDCAVADEDGNVKKIFGQFSKSKMNEKETQCECSVVAYKAMIMNQELRALPFDVYQPSARCLPNGQFDPLQCIDDQCGCVDKDTGIPDENGFIYSVQALERKHPVCFDPSRHKRGEYYTLCEKRRNRLMKDINEKYWKDINFVHFKEVNCFPDGRQVS